MTGRFALFLTSFVIVGTVSGFALGRYATSDSDSVINPDRSFRTLLVEQVGNPDARYGSFLPAAVAASPPAYDTPHCKGCGPTLSERRMAADYGDGYRPFDPRSEDTPEDLASVATSTLPVSDAAEFPVSASIDQSSVAQYH